MAPWRKRRDKKVCHTKVKNISRKKKRAGKKTTKSGFIAPFSSKEQTKLNACDSPNTNTGEPGTKLQSRKATRRKEVGATREIDKRRLDKLLGEDELPKTSSSNGLLDCIFL